MGPGINIGDALLTFVALFNQENLPMLYMACAPLFFKVNRRVDELSSGFVQSDRTPKSIPAFQECTSGLSSAQKSENVPIVLKILPNQLEHLTQLW